MNRNELPAQAANIKQAVGSSATCTTATADSLKAFLLPTRSIHFQEKASVGASRCLKPKPPKAQRTRETKKSKQKTSVEVPEVSSDGPVVLHAQEKWLLATEIANITLRTLTDTIKNIPAQKADCGRPSSKSVSCSLPIRQDSDKETPVPLQPISVNRLSNLQEDQRRSRRSSSGSASNQRQGLRAQAECARIAFAALRSMHLHDDIGQDLPLLQLETGMSALIGKLIAIGFNDLATKELRILRKRLNLNIQALTGNATSDLARTKKSLADDAPWLSKESLESLLDFHVPTDSGSLLALVVTSQLQALKLIFLLGTSDVIDASLKHLQLSSPHSPANLIELQVDKTSPESNIKVTRQLESLSQLLLALCTNSSTIPGGKNGGLCRRPSPETNFGIQTAVLEIRLRQWKLLSHKNDISKEIIKPFAVYLGQFCRQSSLTPQEKYSMSRTAYERLTTSDGPTASSAPEQRWLAVYRRLADLAQECGRLDESLQWLQYAKTLFSESEIGSCWYCAISCRVINIRLGAPINTSDSGELLVSLKDACESLKGDLRGETADLDDLMTIVLISRRLAFSIIHGYQKAPPKAESRAKAQVIHYCSDLILFGLKFLVRYVTSGSRNDKASSRYNQGMQVVWNNARLFIESIAAMTRFSVASQMQNWERLESGLQDCTKLVTALTNLQYTGSTPSLSHDMKELSFIPISNAYWCRHLYLKQKGSSSQEIRRSLHIAINLLRSRPALEKLDGLLPAKLEKFGLLYEASKEYAHATDTYAEALQLLVQSSTFKAAVVACQSMCIAKVLGEPSEYSIFGRLLLSYVRAASRIDHHDTDARLCFDDDTLLPGERGLLLEQQLIALSSIIHKKGASVNIRRMIQVTSALLLTIYENHEFPIRRLRVVLLSLQIRFTDPMAIEVNTAEQILEHGLQGSNMNLLQFDAGLQRFGAHLLQCRDLYLALLEVAVKTQVLEENLMLWSTMLQDSTWESVCNQVNDVGHWILQLQFLEEYLETQGLDLLRVRTLQLITTLQELREPIEPSAALSSFSRLASQYARLGYATEAGDALQRSTKYLDSGASSDTMMSWNLAFAEVAIGCGNATRAEEYFSKAHKAFQGTAESENANGTTFRRSIKTTQLMSDIYYVSSLLSKEKGEIAKAFLYARIHVKLGYRAWTTIELQQSKSMASRPLADMLSESESDDVAHQMANLSLAKREPSPVTSPKLASLNSVPFWSTLRRLYDGLVHLSQLFAHWGLFPEARYYMEQGLKFAEAAHAPSLKSQALSCLGDYLTRNGDVEQGIHLLKQADSMRSGLHIDPHTVLLQVFKAKSYTQDNDAKSVSDTFEYANQVLEQLSTNLVMKELNLQPVAAQDLSAEMTKLSLREGHPTRRPQTRERIASKKGGNKLAAGVKATTARGATIPFPGISILSRLKAVILREQASFATNIDKFELAASLFSEAAKVPVTPHDLMLNNLGAGRLYLCQAIEAMAADPIFCVLPESTTSQPCICVVRGRPGTSASERSPKKKVVGSPRKAPTKGASRDTKGKCASSPVLFADLLGQAHDNISSVYEHAKRAFSTPIVHSMADLLTRTLALISASTASQTKGAANSVFALYAMEIGRTLSMMRAGLAVQVEQQLSDQRHLLDWPTGDIEDGMVSAAEKTFHFSTFQSLYIDIIPPSWTVLSLSLSESQDEIRVARVRSGQSPFILNLPLKRHNFRDPEEEYFGFKSAKEELQEIVNLANFSAHDAQDMTRKGARSEWWEVRTALDNRLYELLHNMENVWLGGFRGIFSPNSHSPELLSRFQQSLHIILDKHLPSRQKQGRAKASGRITLDPRVLELFVGLGIPSEQNDLDDVLMDLLYFVIDIFQFHGEHNAYDEIDFDSISIEVLDALRHYHKAVNDEVRHHKSRHTILILDKALHCFPWESLPCLREHAVSRLPSLACLRDRILQQQHQKEGSEHNEWDGDGFQVDRRNGAAVLNPTGDLTATQAVFEPALEGLRDWDIITQRGPSEEEMKLFLGSRSVFLYFGHGSGAQYIRSRTVKKLERCAVTLLMGCSSGLLSEAGEFEPHGTPINYIQGGCPALVANLWDVTDKDIDKFCLGTLRTWGLLQEDKTSATHNAVRAGARQRGQKKGGDFQGMEQELISLDQAVANSRDLCKLRYLNGAAPVVYGIPVFLV